MLGYIVRQQQQPMSYMRVYVRACVRVCPLQGVTAASSGTHTHAGAESRRLAWRCLAPPSAGHRSYRRGAAEIPAGVSVTVLVSPCVCVVTPFLT